MASIMDLEQYTRDLQARTRAEILTLRANRETTELGKQHLGSAGAKGFSLEIVDLNQEKTERLLLGITPDQAIRQLRQIARQKGWQ